MSLTQAVIDSDELMQLTNAVHDTRILVVGDVIADEYLWGTTTRISPEAPVPVVVVEREELRAGGAGNVACNLAALGAQVTLCSIVGRDDAADQLTETLAEFPAISYQPVVAADRTTPRKSRLMASSQQTVRIDRETLHCSPTAQAQLLQKIAVHLPTSDAVVLSDYAKGVLDENLIEQVIELARSQRIPIIVDPKRADLNVYRGATLITPNLREFSTAMGGQSFASRIPDSIARPAETLRRTCGLEAMAVTIGSQGIVLVTEQQRLHLPAVQQQVFDVTGAGDTVVAIFAIGLASGHSFTQCGCLANIAAGLVIAKVGTATVTWSEIREHLLTTTAQSAQHALSQPESLAELLRTMQAQGKRIVFTNGCFDILHDGHIHLLQQCKQAGDVLVVGLNSDESIRRLKGDSRPFLHLNQRATILKSLQAVDYVVAFEQDTPLELIETLLPDVLVKGGDYQPHEVVGRDVVEANGGELLLIPLVEGVSTTTIAQRITDANKGENT